MLRHIVMWKVAGDTKEARDAVRAELRARLEALPAQLEMIRRFEIGVNDLGADNYDVVLVSEFDDADALTRYVQHPIHQKVVGYVRENTVGRAAVDYTL
jgi:hypothetical protein